MAQKHHTGDENLQTIEETLTKSEKFIETNSKKLTIGLVAVLLIIGLFVAYQKWYVAPKEENAHNAMFVAEQYFAKDSFNLCLNGDGNYDGVLKVIDEFGSTKSGNLAKYYAGISYYKLNNYDKAIELLSAFSTNDKILQPITNGCIGDAYTEKGDFAKATEYYQKAANSDDNEFTAPIYLMKLGQVHESQKNWQAAFDAYSKIKKDYGKTQEARTITKYIERVKRNL